MDFTFSPEQEMLRDIVRGFLTDRSPMQQVRTIMETDTGFSPELWAELAELGMLGIQIPEAHGGAGFTFTELGIVMEELGRGLTPIPFLSTVVLGVGALQLAATEAQQAELLPLVATGELRLALATDEPNAAADSGISSCSAEVVATGFRISGTKSYVIDGHTADLLIVAAEDNAGRSSLYLVPGDAPGVSRTRLETMDMTRKLAIVELQGVEVPSSALLGSVGSGAATLDKLLDLAVTALAWEQLGGAQVCLDASVEYAKVRHQFGRPIGSFQAVKHKCADMLVRLESARSAAYHAGWAAATDAAELRVAAPLAKSYCSDAYFSVAADNIQVHGGIGFTWEHDAHLYFKRAKSSQLLFGDPTHWRAMLADRIGV